MTLSILLLALKSLRSNKLRSGLSVLGIVIGTFTIVFVNAISGGVDSFIKNQLSFLNATSIFVEPSSTSLASSRLREEDLNEVIPKTKHILMGSVLSMGRANISAENKTEGYMLIGTDENFLKVMSFSLSLGRYFTKSEVVTSNKVVIIGKDIANKFFDREDVVGESITIAKKKFRIIGVLGDAPSLSGMSFNAIVYIPYTTSKRFLIGQNNNTLALVFVARNAESVTLAAEEIRIILRKLHNIREGEVDDFNVFEQKSMVSAINLITQALAYLLIGIAVLILIVSGVGIMNIMYASVAERTQDIGVLRAIGARQQDIVIQFLAESVILALFGACIGILLSETCIFIINHLNLGFELVRGIFGDIFALGFTGTLAVFFGIYPAIQASKLDPVEALK
ncbi:MAG: ABC transporter permease [Candidatus Gracilibacteria bacterium]|nr:ABC transporter permease [Candidatus Gracilibacteria bacterium]